MCTSNVIKYFFCTLYIMLFQARESVWIYTILYIFGGGGGNGRDWGSEIYIAKTFWGGKIILRFSYKHHFHSLGNKPKWELRHSEKILCNASIRKKCAFIDELQNNGPIAWSIHFVFLVYRTFQGSCGLGPKFAK